MWNNIEEFVSILSPTLPTSETIGHSLFRDMNTNKTKPAHNQHFSNDPNSTSKSPESNLREGMDNRLVVLKSVQDDEEIGTSVQSTSK